MPSALSGSERNCPAVAFYLDTLNSERSRRTMRSALSCLGQLLDDPEPAWLALDLVALGRLRAALIARYERPRTVNTYLSALRGVLRAAEQVGTLTPTDHQVRARVLARMPSPRTDPSTTTTGRRLSLAELTALFAACQGDGHRGTRDSAILAILYGAGLRVGAAADLKVRDIDLEGVSVSVRRGKGGADRRIPVGSTTAQAVARWAEILRGATRARLWTRVLKDGRLVRPPSGLTSQGIRELLASRAKRAGVSHFTPHDLRRTYVSNLLEEGVDVLTVQLLAGHASSDTTRRYDLRGEARLRAAAERLVVPVS